MSDIGHFKLSDALSKNKKPVGSDEGVKPAASPRVAAEETRENQEMQEARDAEASIRERMVKIGRGNQQAGRQGQ